MINKILALVVFLLVICLSACSIGGSAQTTITYVGNSGFLITVGDKKVLIDGIIKGIPPEYTPPAEVRDLLHSYKPPFDDIDLILVSHAHDDHFDVNHVSAYLADNPKTVLISTQEVADTVLAFDSSLSGRVIAAAPQSGERQELEENGIQVNAFDISHGPGGGANLGFLVTANGIKFFHPGDLGLGSVTTGYLQQLGLPEEQIDIAFFPHFSFREPNALQMPLDGIAAKYYIPIHYYFTSPAFNAATIRVNFPDAVLFEHELDSWTMP